MKFKDDRPFATPESAERKLLELANAMEADHAGRLSVQSIRSPGFLRLAALQNRAACRCHNCRFK
jgi:hypothetical protein